MATEKLDLTQVLKTIETKLSNKNEEFSLSLDSAHIEFLGNITEKLDKDISFTLFTLDFKGNKTPEILAFEAKIHQIAGRNQLIRELKQIGLDPTEEGFDPWVDTLMFYVLRYGYTGTSEGAGFEFPSSSASAPGGGAIAQMGLMGFQAMMKAVTNLTRLNQEKIFKPTLNLNTNLSVLECLQIMREVSEKENFNIPFSEIVIHGFYRSPYMTPLDLENTTLLTFLENNRHLTSLKIEGQKVITHPFVTLKAIEDDELSYLYEKDEFIRNNALHPQLEYKILEYKRKYEYSPDIPEDEKMEVNVNYIFFARDNWHIKKKKKDGTIVRIKIERDTELMGKFQEDKDQGAECPSRELVKKLEKHLKITSFVAIYYDKDGKLQEKEITADNLQWRKFFDRFDELKQSDSKDDISRMKSLQKNIIQKLDQDNIIEDLEKQTSNFFQQLKDRKICTRLRTWPDDFNLTADNIILTNQREQNFQPSSSSSFSSGQPLQKPALNHVEISWAKPRKQIKSARLQISHSVAQSVTQQTAVNQNNFISQSIQRQQQIAQQAHRQQQMQQTANKANFKIVINKNDLYDQSNFQNLFRSDELLGILVGDIYKDLDVKDNVWKNLVGEKLKIVDYATHEAMITILTYPEIFLSGIIPSRLPKGFYIHEQDGKKILCYDKRYVNNTVTEEFDLIPVLRRGTQLQFETSATAEQFFKEGMDKKEKKIIEDHYNNILCRNSGDDPSIKELTNSFLYVLKLMPGGGSIGKNIEDNYINILQRVLKIEYFKAFSAVLLRQGPQGVETFLQKLSLMQSQPGLLDSFFKLFIDKSQNLSELATPESFAAMDALASMGMNELTWWINLTAQQEKVASISHLPDMVKAFKYFVSEIEKFGTAKKPLTLPLNCEVTDAHNMNVVLYRLLLIVKNAADPVEQLSQVGNISLSCEGAYFAISEEKFNFVSGEMALVPEHSEQADKLSYRISKEELFNKSEQLNSMSDFKKYFFRYMGLATHTYSYDYYKKAWSRIEALKNKFSEKSLNQFAANVIIAMTGAEIFSVDPSDYLTKILTEMDGLNDQDVLAFSSWLKKFSLTASTNTSSITLSTLLGVIKFHKNNNLKNFPDISFVQKNHADILPFVLSTLGYRQVRWSDVEPSVSEFEEILPTLNGRYSEDMQKALLKLLCIMDLDKNENHESSIKKIISCFDGLTNRHSPEFISKVIQELITIIDIEHSNVFPTIDHVIKILSNCETADSNELRRVLHQINPGIIQVSMNTGVLKNTRFNELIANAMRSNAIVNILKQLGMSENYEAIVNAIEKNDDIILTDVEKIFENLLSEKTFQNKFFLEGFLLAIKPVFTSVIRKKTADLLSENHRDYNDLTSAFEKYMDSIGKNAEEYKNYFKKIKEIDNLIDALQKTTKKDNSMILDVLMPSVIKILNRGMVDPTTISKVLEIKDDHLKILIIELLEKESYGFSTKEVNDLLSYYENIQTNPDLLETLKNKNNITASDIVKYLQQAQKLRAIFDKIEHNALILSMIQSTKINPASLESITKCIDKHYRKLDGEQKKHLIKILQRCLGQSDLSDGLLITITNHLLTNLSFLPILFSAAESSYFPDLKKLSTLVTQISNGTSEIKDLKDDILENEKNPFKSRRGFEDVKNLHRYDKVEIARTVNGILNKFLNPEHVRELDKKSTSQTVLLPEKQRVILFKSFELMVQFGIDIVSNLDNAKMKEHIAILINAIRDPDNFNTHIENALFKSQIEQLIKLGLSEKQAAKILLLAYSRIVVYRTSDFNQPIFPDNTQIIGRLLNIVHDGNLITDIATGEGKSVTNMLDDLLEWSEGRTLVSVTSDHKLAERDYLASQRFFKYFNIETGLIHASSSAQDFKHGGINFSTPSEFELFRHRMELNGTPIDADQNEKFSLRMDEADQFVLDDNALYIVSGGDDDYYAEVTNPDEWMYEHINDFADFMEGKIDNNHPCLNDLNSAYSDLRQRKQASLTDKNKKGPTILEELNAVWAYLYKVARDQNKDLKRFSEKDFIYSLDEWVTSAYKLQSMNLKEGKDFRVVKKKISDKEYYYACIMKDGLDQEGAQWSNGVHQLTHARLSRQPKYLNQKIPFLFEHERKSLSISNSRKLIEFFLTHGGRIQGATGSSGSSSEVKLLRREYNMDVYHIPTHQEVKRQIREELLAVDFKEQVNLIHDEIENTAPDPKLIYCKDMATLQMMKKSLENKGLKNIIILTAEEAANPDPKLMEALLKKAGQSNAVTLTTYAERGVDIKISQNMDEYDAKLKLVVIDTDFVPERRQVQRKGRTARKGNEGIYRRILNREAFKKEYGIDLPSDPIERKSMLKQLSHGLDKKSKLTIYQHRAFIEVMSVVQDYLQHIYTELGESDDKNEFNRYRQKVLKKCEEKWQDCLILTDFHTPTATLSFIAEADKSLKRIYGQYREKIKKLKSIDLITILKENEIDRQAAMTSMGRREDSEILARVELSSPANLHRNIFPLLRSSAFKRDRDQFFNSRTIKQNDDLYQLMLEKISQSMMYYLNNADLADDRQNSAEILKSSVDARPININWTDQLKNLNNSFNDTLVKDLEVEKIFYKRNRKGNSRYRFDLINLKSYLLTVCPANEFDNLLKAELGALEKFVELESQRSYFNQPEHQDLKNNLIKLKNAISTCQNTLNAKNLEAITTELKTLYAHPEFNAKLTDVKLIENHIYYLSQLYAQHQPAKNKLQSLTIDMQHEFEILARKMPHFSAPKVGTFFNQKENFYIGDVNPALPYAGILSERKVKNNPSAQYYYAQIFEYLTGKITQDIKGFDVKFNDFKINGMSSAFTVSFYQFDPKTYDTMEYTVNMEVDLKQKKLNLVHMECQRCDQKAVDNIVARLRS